MVAALHPVAGLLQAILHSLFGLSRVEIEFQPLARSQALEGEAGPDEVHRAGRAPQVEPAGDRGLLGVGHGGGSSVAVAEQAAEQPTLVRMLMVLGAVVTGKLLQ
jgi:hypothetical protein